jgi:lipoprotein-anchoring transpeptidase ErfK/SrfK
MRVSGRRISIVNIASERFWQIAVLTAAGTIGAASQADAALYYWQDSDPGYYRPSPTVQPRRQKTRQPSAKTETAEKETGAKPQGPLIIAISIDKQKVRIYDANGFFAESPVSTGMKGHSTPMGVFSIIQKHKFHHSNIYSGAPMPYMQRITWSGVAMHAGVLPGYPASHGCIRMPMAFAMKMWNWTRMGARVIVTPGEITPANFSHPLLVAQKVLPQPAIADEPKTDTPAVKTDKGADAGTATRSAKSEADLELRSTVGHSLPVSTPWREQTHTADASNAMSATNAAVTMSDVSTGNARPPSSEAAPALGADAAATDTKPAEAAASETKSPEAAAAEVKSAETIAADKDDKKVDEAQAPLQTSGDAAKTEASASENAKTIEKPVEAKSDQAKSDQARSDDAKIEPAKTETAKTEAKVETPKVETLKADEPKAIEKPAEPAKAIADAPAVDVKKDSARLPGVEKTITAKPEAPKRAGQIAVFVSRKDSKLYVRQEFKPLFDVSVTIAPSDRPLGTHVFTAEADKRDPNLLRWSVVSLPVTARNAARSDDDDDRPARRRRIAGAAAEIKAVPVPDSPAEALDRVTIPPDAMARIAEALSTGSSIIISDQGINQGETGEGTDFIVSLR